MSPLCLRKRTEKIRESNFIVSILLFNLMTATKFETFCLNGGVYIFCLCEDIKVWLEFYFTNRHFEKMIFIKKIIVSIYFTTRPLRLVFVPSGRVISQFRLRNYFTYFVAPSPPQNNISRRISEELSRIRI